MSTKVVIADFKIFQAAYPRKEKIPAARGAWNRLMPSPALLKKMLKAIEIQKKPGGILAPSVEHGDKYIPYAVSWLSNERWTELDVPEKSGITDIVCSREYDLAEVIALNIYPELTFDTIGDYE